MLILNSWSNYQAQGGFVMVVNHCMGQVMKTVIRLHVYDVIILDHGWLTVMYCCV